MELNPETGELYQVYIDELDTIFLHQNAKVRKFKAYFRGKNPTLLDKPAQAKPDNRVPTPIARKLVKQMKGYGSRAGYIQYSTEDPEYIAMIKNDVLDMNDEELLTSELFENACSIGWGYELLRVDEQLGIRMYRVKPQNGWMVYDNTLEERKLAFVVRDRIQRVDGGKVVDYDVQTIYYDTFFVEYMRPMGGGQWQETDRRDHPFGFVPGVKYVVNNEETPIFEPVIPLIDEHDKVISTVSNELEKFAQAVLLSLLEIDQETSENVQFTKIFDSLGIPGENRSVQDIMAYLVKPSRGDDNDRTADRLERLIYDQAMIVNLADLNLGANMSSKALRDKILLMEWLMADCEAYFSKGLQERFTLIANAMTELRGNNQEWVTISWRRNLPPDLEAMARSADLLRGTLSLETILKTVFPADIVPDVMAEIDRLRETSLPAISLDDDDSPNLN